MRFQFINETINDKVRTPSLTKSETQSWLSETMASPMCFSSHAKIGWILFGVRGTYFHCFMYQCFSHWLSLHPSVLMQTSPKHAYFLLVKPTQPIKTACWLQPPYTPIRQNPMHFEWYVVFSEWFINQAKAMLNEQCVILMIITDV